MAERANVAQSSVSSNKTFLVQSAKLLVETGCSLALVAGAEPSWWEKGDVMSGVSTPEQVEEWWHHRTPPPDGGGGSGDKADHHDYGSEKAQNGLIYAENGDRSGSDREPIMIGG